MSTRLTDLCHILVENAFGRAAAQLFLTLARRGRTTLSQLHHLTRTPVRQLRSTLTILTQHHIVLHYAIDDGEPTYFQVDWHAAYAVVRFEKMASFVEARHGDAAGQLIRNILQMGQTSVGDLEEDYGLRSGSKRDSGIDSSGEPAGEEDTVDGITKDEDTGFESTHSMTMSKLHDTLRVLLQEEFLMKVGLRSHMPPSDMQQELNDTVMAEHFPDGKVTGAKKKERFDAAVHSLKRKWQSEDEYSEQHDIVSRGTIQDSTTSASDRKRVKLNGDLPNGVHHARADHDKDVEYAGGPPVPKLSIDIVVRVNFAKCITALRSQRLERTVDRHLGPVTAAVYAAFLRAVEHKTKISRDPPKAEDEDDLDDGEDHGHNEDPFEYAGDGKNAGDVEEGCDVEDEDDVKYADERNDADRKGNDAHKVNRADDKTENDDEKDDVDEQQLPSATDAEILAHLDKSVDLASTIKDTSFLHPNGVDGGDDKDRVLLSRDDAEELGIKRERGSESPAPPSDDDDDDDGTNPYSKSHRRRLHLLDMHLALLAEHPKRFIRRSNPATGRSHINLRALTTTLIRGELDTMVSARFDAVARRVVRMLRTHGKLDEKRLAGLSMMRIRDVRAALTTLQFHGLVDVQELPRDGTRQPSRTLYLWCFDERCVRDRYLQHAYQGMTRLLQRLRVERHLYRTVIERETASLEAAAAAAAADAVPRGGNDGDPSGRDASGLDNMPERKSLGRWRVIEQRLLVQVERIDDVVALLRDFSGMDTSLDA